LRPDPDDDAKNSTYSEDVDRKLKHFRYRKRRDEKAVERHGKNKHSLDIFVPALSEK